MELQAPPGWRSIDFISDLHLQASEAKTFQAWQHYLTHTTADAVICWVMCLKFGSVTMF